MRATSVNTTVNATVVYQHIQKQKKQKKYVKCLFIMFYIVLLLLLCVNIAYMLYFFRVTNNKFASVLNIISKNKFTNSAEFTDQVCKLITDNNLQHLIKRKYVRDY